MLKILSYSEHQIHSALGLNEIKIYVRSLFTALKENDLEYIKMYKYEL